MRGTASDQPYSSLDAKASVAATAWSSDIFGSFCDDPCFLAKMYLPCSPHHIGFCCCPMMYATAVEHALGRDAIGSWNWQCCLAFCGFLCNRRQLVKKYAIKEGMCTSHFYSNCCCLCAAVQEIREIELREGGRVSVCNAQCPPTVFKMHRENSSATTHTQRFKKSISLDSQQTSKSISTLQIICPPGVKAGATLMVRAPEGQQLQVTVPLGVVPGQKFSCSY